MLRAIREIQPRWVVGENVFGLINWSDGLVFNEVQTDLEAEGYEVFPYVLPACATNAPHRRDRVWFVAYSNSFGNNRMYGSEASNNEGQQPKNKIESGNGWTSETERYGKSGIITDTNSNGQQRRNCEHEINTGEGRFDAFGNIVKGLDNGDAANTCSTRQQKQHISEIAERERYSSWLNNANRTDWQNFPTQPPICNGDDGVSSELDGITFPKWRNESIKAGGNAIVPQVALQIFKSIQQYEDANNPKLHITFTD